MDPLLVPCVVLVVDPVPAEVLPPVEAFDPVEVEVVAVPEGRAVVDVPVDVVPTAPALVPSVVVFVTVGATWLFAVRGEMTSAGICCSTLVPAVSSERSSIEIAPELTAIVPTPTPAVAVIPAKRRGT